MINTYIFNFSLPLPTILQDQKYFLKNSIYKNNLSAGVVWIPLDYPQGVNIFPENLFNLLMPGKCSVHCSFVL